MDATGRARHGFTLLELVVVMAILAGLVAIAYPQFAGLYASVRARLAADDFERQLFELPQRVRQSGHGGILTSRSGDDLPEGTVLRVEGAPQTGAGIEDWQVLRLDLPRPWRLVVAEPVFYHFTGACEGGEVVFRLPPRELRYRLTAPLCRPIRERAGS